MALRHLILVTCASCASTASGSITAAGPPGWTLAPDTCVSGTHQGYWGVDLYQLDPSTDTELVVEDGVVLARVPGRGAMLRFDTRDCRVLDIDLHTNGIKVNDDHALSGHITLDCQRPEMGRVTGEATFFCL